MEKERESALDVRNLTCTLGERRVLDDVSFTIGRGSITALTGRSGEGKSTLASLILALMRSESGSIRVLRRDGSTTDMMSADERELCAIRGNEVSLIFQEPMSALNPVFPVSRQIGDVLRIHTSMKRRERRERVEELLSLVGFSAPDRIARSYPHELSGGMRQRVLIAEAIALSPVLLIADEPVTALDAKTGDEIISLLQDLKKQIGTTLLIITHDSALASAVADEVLRLESGRISKVMR